MATQNQNTNKPIPMVEVEADGTTYLVRADELQEWCDTKGIDVPQRGATTAKAVPPADDKAVKGPKDV